MTFPMTAADDELHPPPDDDPFWTETLWLGFGLSAHALRLWNRTHEL